MSDEVSLREKLAAVRAVVEYRPTFAAGILVLSFVAAILEGIGLSFILPILEFARGAGSDDPSALMQGFLFLYETAGVPFTLESVILGVTVVMVARYTATFMVSWLRASLRTGYVEHLRRESLRSVLYANVAEIDRQGSDDILNAIITQTEYASRLIRRLVELTKVALVCTVYLLVALYISPLLTVFAVVVLGSSTFLLRAVFSSGHDIGSRVAQANEEIQGAVQAGTQGIRDVKAFGMEGEILRKFDEQISEFVDATIKQRRNRSGINNFQQLISALSVFVLIYVGLRFASLTIGSLGVFLFAMFRLSPRVSTLNNLVYEAETEIPHVIRSQNFIEAMRANEEMSGDRSPPETVTRVEFDDVTFSYDADAEPVLDDISLHAEAGEMVAFVGQSGAGKSTVVSLLARLYDPDDGEILIDGTSLSELDIAAWREHVALVRQNPFIFNDTLRYNLTLGRTNPSESELERVAAVARVDEFLDDLPDGYDTQVGDNGVRLSGGQQQRVALARALLKDAEVLILDEATSDLDTNIEADIQTEIESLRKDYITVTVAHRLSTVRSADRIYTFEDGRITEVGSHEELLASDGKYAELYSQ